MNPTNILFTTISNLTGGLITDVTTLIVGMVTLAFILMGLDILKDVILDGINGQNASKRRMDSYGEFQASGKAAGLTDSEIEMEGNKVRFESSREKYKRSL